MAENKGGKVMDGSDIMELVENKEVFSKYIDHKFKELDVDNDGHLSVNELQPAIAHIGLALGLPPQGSSSDSDHIYSENLTSTCKVPENCPAYKLKKLLYPLPIGFGLEPPSVDEAGQVLNEFTHGKEEKVSKSGFKEVLSDILIGMAAGLKRDPIVILRIDGEDLKEFFNAHSFEADALSLFSEVESSDATLRDHVLKALQKLGVDQGLPPTNDPWVMSNVLEPALKTLADSESNEKPVSQETFLKAFKDTLAKIVERLKEQPVIVAHTENTYDGSTIRTLLANKFETDKVLDAAIGGIPRDKHGKLSKEYLKLALDSLGPSAGLPPYGAINEMDSVINNVFEMVEAKDGKLVKEEEFKKLLLEILGSLMLQLEGNPVSVSANSVVHEPLADPSSILAA